MSEDDAKATEIAAEQHRRKRRSDRERMRLIDANVAAPVNAAAALDIVSLRRSEPPEPDAHPSQLRDPKEDDGLERMDER